MVGVCIVLGILLITGASYTVGNNCESTGARGPLCFNNGRCVESENGFACECPKGTLGTRCEFQFSVQIVSDPCDSKPCMNGGFCSRKRGGGYRCHCVSGYVGKHCETNEDDCALARLHREPCMNGGKCRDSTHGYLCDCPRGFSGDFCEILDYRPTAVAITVTDPCESAPCMNGAGCSWVRGDEYRCYCVSGFVGDHCETNEDDCAFARKHGEPCMNGGTCHDGVHGYLCECKDGFFGDFCEKENRIQELTLDL